MMGHVVDSSSCHACSCCCMCNLFLDGSPYMLQCKDVHLCGECYIAYEWLVCPVCNVAINCKKDHVSLDRWMRRNMKTEKVECQACTTVMLLSEFREHRNICKSPIAECTCTTTETPPAGLQEMPAVFSCTYRPNGCMFRGTHDEIANHIGNPSQECLLAQLLEELLTHANQQAELYHAQNQDIQSMLAALSTTEE